MPADEDETQVFEPLQLYRPGDYVHVLAKVVEADGMSLTVQLRGDDTYVLAQYGDVSIAPVPTPEEPLDDDVMVFDASGNIWHPGTSQGERRWFTSNDVLGDSWENVFRKRGPLRIFGLRTLTDDPNGNNS